MLSMVPKPGCLKQLVEHFQAEKIFERALAFDGCNDVMMLQKPDQVVVLAFWDDAQAYQRWVDNPERAQGNDNLNALLVEPITAEVVGGLFDVVLSTQDSAWTAQ